MLSGSLFDLLDLDHDGSVSRSELHAAARRLGWHWREAPILALLDLLTLHTPLSRQQFTAIVQQIREDPLGPYGKVLLNTPLFAEQPRGVSSSIQRQSRVNYTNKDLLAAIEKLMGKQAAADYQKWYTALPTQSLGTDQTALLIIDPQRSFTEGAWMQSIGDGAANDVKPIVFAFNNCTDVIASLYGRMDIMFSRCPFPPGSYDWDDRLATVIDHRQLYFIKPGNSILFPPFNGFREWIARCIDRGIRTLIIGGCTLNSCVRVSSIDVRRLFKDKQLQVVVDLSLCGARLRNYAPSPAYNGLSAVASAVDQMDAAGVQVVRQIDEFRD